MCKQVTFLISQENGVDTDSMYSFSGGRIVTEYNHITLKQLFGDDQVITVILHPKEKMGNFKMWVKKIIKLFIILYEIIFKRAWMSTSVADKITKAITCSNWLFIDNVGDAGWYAKFAKKINPQIKVVTHFHNIETDLIQRIRSSQIKKIEKRMLWKYYFASFFYPLLYQVMVNNEKIACQYSDYLLVLTSRDHKILNDRYPFWDKKKIVINTLKLSNCLTDVSQLTFRSNTSEKKKSKFDILFIGSYIHVNIQAICWFINQVMFQLQKQPLGDRVRFKVAGSGIEKYNFPYHPQVEMLGTIKDNKDLITHYFNVDLLVAPLFFGGGIKIKTLEALSYGKYLLGTKESFIGLPGFECSKSKEDYLKIGGLCDSAEDYVARINFFLAEKYERNQDLRYNPDSRKLYETYIAQHQSLNKTIFNVYP